jgi:hypothetical protein
MKLRTVQIKSIILLSIQLFWSAFGGPIRLNWYRIGLWPGGLDSLISLDLWDKISDILKLSRLSNDTKRWLSRPAETFNDLKLACPQLRHLARRRSIGKMTVWSSADLTLWDASRWSATSAKVTKIGATSFVDWQSLQENIRCSCNA